MATDETTTIGYNQKQLRAWAKKWQADPDELVEHARAMIPDLNLKEGDDPMEEACSLLLSMTPEANDHDISDEEAAQIVAQAAQEPNPPSIYIEFRHSHRYDVVMVADDPVPETEVLQMAHNLACQCSIGGQPTYVGRGTEVLAFYVRGELQ